MLPLVAIITDCNELLSILRISLVGITRLRAHYYVSQKRLLAIAVSRVLWILYSILFYSILFYSIVWNPGVSRVEQLAQSRVEESVRPLLAGTVVCHNIPSGAPLAQLC